MRKIIVLAAAAALAGPALAKGPAERLVSPGLPDFVIGYERGNAQQSIREEVPRGESVTAWKRMVTTQRFIGLAARATPEQYAGNILAAMPRQCPGASASPVVSLRQSNRRAVRFQVDCPRSVGNRPESFVLLAIAGNSDMHVKQVAFRGGMSSADLQWANRFLTDTRLCTAGDKTPACR